MLGDAGSARRKAPNPVGPWINVQTISIFHFPVMARMVRWKRRMSVASGPSHPSQSSP